ncbi:hypothetical protein BGZ47_001730 [Haplosporangium gracile]|nr:hypothetical protein BGZ47_001730 [Haplosporangium gracile]
MYYICPAAKTCGGRTNRVESMETHLRICNDLVWTPDPKLLLMRDSSADPHSSQRYLGSETSQGSSSSSQSYTTKRKARSMTKAIPSSVPSASPPPKASLSMTPQLRSVSPSPSQSSVSQHKESHQFLTFASQMKLFVRESQCAMQESQVAIQESRVAIQESTAAMTNLVGKVETLIKQIKKNEVEQDSRWAKTEEQIVLNDEKLRTLQVAIESLHNVKKQDDLSLRIDDILQAIQDQRNDSQDIRCTMQSMSLRHLPPSLEFSEFDENLTLGKMTEARRKMEEGLKALEEEYPSKRVRYKTSTMDTNDLPDDDSHIQRNQAALAARQNQEFNGAQESSTSSEFSVTNKVDNSKSSDRT